MSGGVLCATNGALLPAVHCGTRVRLACSSSPYSTALTSPASSAIMAPPSSEQPHVLHSQPSHSHFNERILVIEDTTEIQLKARNLLQMEARELTGSGLSIRDLAKASLRHPAGPPDPGLVSQGRGNLPGPCCACRSPKRSISWCMWKGETGRRGVSSAVHVLRAQGDGWETRRFWPRPGR